MECVKVRISSGTIPGSHLGIFYNNCPFCLLSFGLECFPIFFLPESFITQLSFVFHHLSLFHFPLIIFKWSIIGKTINEQCFMLLHVYHILRYECYRFRNHLYTFFSLWNVYLCHLPIYVLNQVSLSSPQEFLT